MPTNDSELSAVATAFHQLDPRGERTAAVLRQTLDQLYDGVHTGRYRWDQLHKTEKTHCGTLVEINLHREFGFDDGLKMDYRIADIEVDCKYSQSVGGWMIPPESMGNLCLLVSADDGESSWNLGLVSIDPTIVSQGGNRDAKRTLTAAGRKHIHWLFKNAALPPNVLLQLPRVVVDQVMSLPSGQQRIDQIFRVAQGKIIGRGVIATLGQQDDYMKRIRGNGGSRSRLKPEGIIILGHYEEHRQIASQLELPVPNRGELVSIRLAPATSLDTKVVVLQGNRWRIAETSDPVIEAPDCPHSK
ncbi:MAG: NaeI family type II restriction endonuclease [Planctomycetota bacterium]